MTRRLPPLCAAFAQPHGSPGLPPAHEAPFAFSAGNGTGSLCGDARRPHPRHDIAALVAACPGAAFERGPALVRQKSRGFFWFSPILNRAFRHKTAEILAQPVAEAEVIPIAASR